MASECHAGSASLTPIDGLSILRLLSGEPAQGFHADVAQLAEQLICNQQVASSNLAVSSSVTSHPQPTRVAGRDPVGYSSGQRDQTVNLTANAFEGSNPSPTMHAGTAGDIGGQDQQVNRAGVVNVA